MKHWPFTVISGENGEPKIQVQFRGETKTYTVEEILAMILCKLKLMSEHYLGAKVDYAVITVPSYFNNAQRHAIKDAAELAG
jgi:heat shock 70kDa protein 1/2/6/8